MIVNYDYQDEVKQLDGWVDSDYAGCRKTRKSTSGGLIMLGSHALKTWSSTQANIALSSGEAEYYAMVKCGSQLLGMNALVRALGIGEKECPVKNKKTKTNCATNCKITSTRHDS